MQLPTAEGVRQERKKELSAVVRLNPEGIIVGNIKKTMKHLIISFFCLLALNTSAHSSFALHKQDMYAVLGVRETPEVTQWMKFISYDLIDNAKGISRDEYGGLAFYDYIKAKYPPFKCKHRLLFHWGYNSQPWSEALTRKVEGYCFTTAVVDSMKKDFVYEQRLRNRQANEMTENLFGFGHSGKEARLANALISIMYDTHLVGDYMTDNRDLDGLPDLTVVLGDFVSSLRKIDNEKAKPIVAQINQVKDKNVQCKADKIMEVLYDMMPKFFQKTLNGYLRNVL